jgi:hypothetical protein
MNFEEKLQQILGSLHGSEAAATSLQLYQFFQQRIETIRTRLWTTLAWLAAAQGAVLVLTIKTGGLRTRLGPDLVLDQPLLIVVLAGLGFLLAYYMRQVVGDGVGHIQSNQKLSNIVFGLPPHCSRETVFAVMGRLADSALVIDGALMIIGILGVLDWLGLDIPHVRLSDGGAIPM